MVRRPARWGLYGPDPSVALNREAMLLLGAGPRALLLQIAHPAVAAGVDEHSDFRADPWRRLDGTLRSYLRSSTARAGGPRRDPAAERAPPRDRRGRATRRAIRSCRCGSTPRSSTRRSSAYDALDRAAAAASDAARVLRRDAADRAGPSACPDALLPPDLEAFEAYLGRMLGPDGPVQPGPLARELADGGPPSAAGPLARSAAAARLTDPGRPTTGRCGRRSACCRRRSRELRLRLGTARAAVSGWLVPAWRAWRPLLPASFRQMPQALAADRADRRRAAGAAGPRATPIRAVSRAAGSAARTATRRGRSASRRPARRAASTVATSS